jgi:hypothetical protein
LRTGRRTLSLSPRSALEILGKPLEIEYLNKKFRWMLFRGRVGRGSILHNGNVQNAFTNMRPY